MGCPIRRSRDQRALDSTPGFSQRATSFIASRCQGIHQMPLPQRLIAQTRRLQRQTLPTNRPSREDTHSEEARSQDTPNHPNSLGIHRSIRPAVNTTLTSSDAASAHSLFTCQRSNAQGPKSQRKLTFPDRSIVHRLPHRPGAVAVQAHRCRTSRRTMLCIVYAVVEVIGIEPTTSCLQSRRSPN